jgi:heptosyltransferase-2
MGKNILAVRNDRFGEFLLNIPAFRALKEGYPNAKLTLVVNPYVSQLAKLIDFVNEIIIWENKKHSLRQILKFSQELKAKKFDLCVIFNPSKEFNIISFLSGIPIRIGYNRKLAFLLTRKINDEKHLGHRHEVDYNLDLLKPLGIKTEDKALSLNINACLMNDFYRGLNLENDDNLVAIHPFTSDPLKEWPLENFRILSERLAQELNKKIIIIGGNEELTKSKDFFNNLNRRIINLTGKTNLTELAGLLKKCKLLISGDSGPVHLACSVGTPVIAIFRNDLPEKSPKRWGPWGKGHMVIEKNNLYDITVDEVFDKVSIFFNT